MFSVFDYKTHHWSYNSKGKSIDKWWLRYKPYMVSHAIN